ncbi:MerR family DNA-binding transcriptional regulator [Ruegeria hyattellae]
MIAIGEASRQSGVGIETIRYYEREEVPEIRLPAC